MLSLAVVLQAGDLPANDAVTASELIIEPPTLICLGFEWRVEGDENANATCEVAYRRKGESAWRPSLPLYRIGAGRTANYGFGNFNDPNHQMRYRIPAALAGSILDLQPGTAYQVRLRLSDPDGVQGVAERILELATRSEPQVPEGGEVRHVYPPGYDGVKEQPAYLSIMHAVNGFKTWCDCYQLVHPNAAPPGTVIKLHGGVYRADYRDYRDDVGLWLHGTRTLIADGTAEEPIAVVAAGDGEVIIDAAGADVAFNIMAADHLYFEGLTIKNARIAFHAGLQGVLGSTGLTVKNCWLENIQYGVLAQDGRSENFYIADNVFLGANPQDRFNPESGGAWGKTRGGYAVNLSGKGHVVCHNYLSGMWDGLNVFTNALADPALEQQARAIDFYNNEVFNSTDNFIEMDGGYANLRVLRNRCFNSLASPVSMQSVYAGPGYWIRNIFWNTGKGHTGMKGGGGADMMVYLHNTTSCDMQVSTDSFDVRNNVFAGRSEVLSHPRRGYRDVLEFDGHEGKPPHVIDHNAYLERPNYPGRFAEVGDESFDSLAAVQQATPYEQHGVSISGYGVFAAADEPNHAASNEAPLIYPHQVDLHPATDSPLVDAGALIEGLDQRFTGDAPDLGAWEAGLEPPLYGPRPAEMRKRLEPIRQGQVVPRWDKEDSW